MSTLIDALKGLLGNLEDYDPTDGRRECDRYELQKVQLVEEIAHQLSEIIAEHERCAGWQPIESAPHGETVLLYCQADMSAPWQEVGYASRGERIHGVSNISAHGHATHWQPLPKGPTE